MKPFKSRWNPLVGGKQTSSATVSSILNDRDGENAYSSLPPFPSTSGSRTTTSSKVPKPESNILDFTFQSNTSGSKTVKKSESKSYGGVGGSLGRAFHHSRFSPSQIASGSLRIFKPEWELPEEIEEEEDDEQNTERVEQRPQVPPAKPRRKSIPSPIGKDSGNKNQQPVLLVPLKTESISTRKSSYPKESYFYQVMGRNSSSTFAPYQRTFNYMPPQFSTVDIMTPWNSNGGPGHGRQAVLVPFSSWVDMTDGQQPGPKTRKSGHSSKSYRMIGKSGTTGRSGTVGLKSTSKILLRDSSGREHGMWATLSQRFKRNFKDNVIPRLNGIWSPHSDAGRGRRKQKKVTFNAWATVQMV